MMNRIDRLYALVEELRAAGAPTFAHLRDPSGNQFGVFSPPAA